MTSTVPLACSRADARPDSREVTSTEYSLLGTMTRCTGAFTFTELNTAVLTFFALALMAMTAARARVMNFFRIVVFYCY